MQETLEGKSEKEVADLLNNTTTVMGNHLYHEAAARGNCTLCPVPPFRPPSRTATGPVPSAPMPLSWKLITNPLLSCR